MPIRDSLPASAKIAAEAARSPRCLKTASGEVSLRRLLYRRQNRVARALQPRFCSAPTPVDSEAAATRDRIALPEGTPGKSAQMIRLTDLAEFYEA